MSRWKALPAELDPRVRQLLVHLRRMKDHDGLTMRRLAARTGYSAKSWERYLNGRSVPPREAVEAMAALTGEDPTRLLALHELALDAWRDRPASPPRRGAAQAAPPGGPPTAPAPPGREPAVPGAGQGAAGRDTATEGGGPEEGVTRDHPAREGAADGQEAGPARVAEDVRITRRTLAVALGAGCAALVLAVAAAVLVTLRLTNDGRSTAHTSVAPAAAASPVATKAAYRCRLEQTGGRWYAGNSRAMDATVAYGDSGPQVAELQCLLRRRGISPGAIDGMFGPLTLGAVERFQIEARLDVDGVAGPHTWKALRG